jgi:hypothetical protein
MQRTEAPWGQDFDAEETEPSQESAAEASPLAGSPSDLALAKIQQRQNLLEQDPEVAQAIANQTLYPHLWQRETSQPWTESLEPNYGTPDP